MKRLIGIVLALLLVAPVSAQSPQIRQLMLRQMPAAAAGGGGNTMALDGGNSGTDTTASHVIALTTTNAPGLIVLGIITSGQPTISSVTATGLTFTANAATPTNITPSDRAFMYTAPYSSNFSGNITINFSGSAYNVASVIGVSGAKTASAEDSGGPVGNSAGAPSETTTNVNDFLVAMFETSGAVATANNGWTGAPSADATTFGYLEYQKVTATGTYTGSMSAGTISGGIITAIKQGP